MKGSIKGKIVDAETGEPLEYATITFIRKRDSSIVGGGITNEKGAFFIETSPGVFTAKFEYISYEPQILFPVKLLPRESLDIDLGTIQLQPVAATTEEVEITAQQSKLQFELDKKVFNVGKDLSRTGSASDILDNIPSVSVDIDGNVSLRGSQNVRILVDGKPSGLTGLSSTDALRQLQANLVEKVEIITNPSARYDAEGMAGIINIVLKKDLKKGLNGTFDLNLGWPHNYGVGASVNFRRKWVNLFVSGGIRYRKGPGNGNSYQEFFLPDTTYYTNRDRTHERGGLGGNIRFGADFFLSKTSTLTAAFLYRGARENNEAQIIYRDFNSSGEQTQTVLRTEDELEEEFNLEYSLDYEKKFKKKKQKLTAALQYRENTEDEGSDLIEQFTDNNLVSIDPNPLLQRSNNKESAKSWLVQSDYIHPIGKDGKFETGVRASLRKIENDYTVEEQNSNEEWVSLANFTNHLNYDENIIALYAMYGNKIKSRFSYQFGLRVEYSDIRTELEETNEVNPREYLNPFPSAHFSYEFNNRNFLQWSYSRRIRRPHFRELNPFFTFSDSRNFFSGNPNLNPEFTHSAEIGYLKYWENASISSSVYYRHTDSVIQRITTVDSEGFSATQPMNLLDRDAYGIEATFSVNPLKWWKIYGSMNFFRAITSGANVDASLASDTYSWMTRMTSRMSFWKNADFQIRFNYRGKEQMTQGTRLPISTMDIGLSKDFLKNNAATLTFNIRDVFNSRRRRMETFGSNFYSNSEFQWRQRQFMLNFTYRLNQKKRRGGGRNGGGGDFDMGI